MAKAKKKSGKKGKGEPFGGAQAKPFGSDGDEAAEGKEKMPAGTPKASKKTAKTAAKGMKPGKGKKPKDGHKPTPGEAGGVPGQHEMPAPPHREPDGGTVEAFERDAHLEDGDNEKPTRLQEQSWKSGDPEAAAALTLKNLDVPQHLGALHALTCPAYDPEAVAKAKPHAIDRRSLARVAPGAWRKAASAPGGEAGAMAVYNAAVALKTADPFALADVRATAYKAFRDANPGPGSFPEPGQISPTRRFRQAGISDGHGAASPGYWGPHTAKIPEEGGIVSTDYQRPYLDAGHASESPDNQHTPGPARHPRGTGVPTSEPSPRVPVVQRHRVHAALGVRDARPHLPPLPRRLPHGSVPAHRLQPRPRAPRRPPARQGTRRQEGRQSGEAGQGQGQEGGKGEGPEDRRQAAQG